MMEILDQLFSQTVAGDLAMFIALTTLFCTIIWVVHFVWTDSGN